MRSALPIKAALSGAALMIGMCLLPAGAPVQAATATTQTVTRMVPLTTGTDCQYRNTASAAASGWQQPAHVPDATWKTGDMSFGHLETVTTDIGVPARTAYFRCSVDVTSAPAVTAARLSFRVDDGAVVYLNGAEISRYNMPGGTVGYNTSASTVDSWDGRRWIDVPIDPAKLRTGANVFAVEVHQNFTSSWISADAVFDAKFQFDSKVPSPAGWKLYANDEFDANAVNTGIWSIYNNSYGDGDPQVLQCNLPENVSVSNGSLKIAAAKKTVTCANGKVKNYTGGFLGSRESNTYYPRYARFEFRAKIDHGQGLWPALWLRHRSGSGVAEVDVMESFHASAPGQAMQTLHFPNAIGYNVAKRSTKVETATSGRGAWHTYTVDILPVTPGNNSAVKFRFAVDGITTLEYTNTKASAFTNVDPMGTWDIALQQYVGGTWVGHPDQQLGYFPAKQICSLTWKTPVSGPSSCPTTGIFPAAWNDPVFEIDYVRVYVPV